MEKIYLEFQTLAAKLADAVMWAESKGLTLAPGVVADNQPGCCCPFGALRLMNAKAPHPTSACKTDRYPVLAPAFFTNAFDLGVISGAGKNPLVGLGLAYRELALKKIEARQAQPKKDPAE